MSLHADLAAWDAKSAEIIARIYDEHAGRVGFESELEELLDDAEIERGVTWLIKRHMERAGGKLPVNLGKALLARANAMQHWEARLHVLQCLPMLELASGQERPCELFLSSCIRGENKFVRAWAYGGYCILATRFPAHRPAVRTLLERGLETEAASVKARIRRAKASTDWC